MRVRINDEGTVSACDAIVGVHELLSSLDVVFRTIGERPPRPIGISIGWQPTSGDGGRTYADVVFAPYGRAGSPCVVVRCYSEGCYHVGNDSGPHFDRPPKIAADVWRLAQEIRAGRAVAR